MAKPENVAKKEIEEVVPPEGTKEGTCHWISGPGWFEDRIWVGTGWKKHGHAYVVSPWDAGHCGWKYFGPISSLPTKSEGVFNFNQSFPGPHMIRVRLTRDRAFETLQRLASMLANDRPVYTLDYFGVLSRHPEEDKGNPIEVGQ